MPKPVARVLLLAVVALAGSAAFAPRRQSFAEDPEPADAGADPAAAAAPADLAPIEPDDAEGERPKYETLAVRGRVVWMAEALERRYGIASDPDAAQANVALETPEGELHLLVKDTRGRAFMLDPRLMEMDLELVLRRFEGAPASQVVKIFAWEEEAKYEFDYWCDICAIPMYELKACECCQGETRIRLRPVADDAR